MSRRGTPRAWQSKSPRFRCASEDEQKEARLAAERVATILGWCMACGVNVDEANGLKHDRWCPDVPIERRRS